MFIYSKAKKELVKIFQISEVPIKLLPRINTDYLQTELKEADFCIGFYLLRL